MKFVDFGVFQKNRIILSREKYIFHMLFGASHGTPRSWILPSSDLIAKYQSLSFFSQLTVKHLNCIRVNYFFDKLHWKKIMEYKSCELRHLITMKILRHCSQPIRVDKFGRLLYHTICVLSHLIRFSMTQNLQTGKVYKVSSDEFIRHWN